MSNTDLPEGLRPNIADLYEHLNDLVWLRTHPLLDRLVPDATLTRKERAWRLHQLLLAVIEEMNPGPGAEPFTREWRRYHLMLWRYVEGMNPKQVAQELAISHRQYYREHDKALDSASELLRQRLAAHAQRAEASESPPDRLELLRLEAARVDQASRYVRLDRVIERTLPILETLFSRRRLTVEQDWLAELPPVLVNEESLRQLMLAVLGHLAAHASDATIRIVARSGNSQVHLRLIVVPMVAFDDGWPTTAQERLPAMQETAMLSKATVALIRAHDTIVGFEIGLPAQSQRAILVIDDDEDFLELFSRLLTPHGYRVITARSYQEALPLAMQLQPYAITLDLMIPRRDGWEILQALRNNPDTHRIPVVVCSVLRQKQLALALGASAFLPKPITEQTLLSALAKLETDN